MDCFVGGEENPAPAIVCFLKQKPSESGAKRLQRQSKEHLAIIDRFSYNVSEVLFMKRSDYLSWDEFFMGLAVLSSMRSKDPSTQVGACIVDKDKKIVSVGYNGMPHCCSDDVFPWDRGEGLSSKYLYVCHAELNAILNCHYGTVRGCTIYCTLFPCNECAKAIIQSGISEVVYLCDKYAETDSVRASKRMLESAGIKCRPHELTGKKVELQL